MSNHPPHSHNPKPAAEETQRPPTSDERLKSFWLKNEKTIYIACIAVIVIVAAFGLFRNMQKNGEEKIGAEYSAASTPDKLRAFIAANSSHPLATAAQVRLADEAFAAKNYIEAASAYDKAAAGKNTPFAGRALLGAAISKAYSGQTVDAENRLKQISADTTQTPAIRSEATYHLASLATAAGRTADAIKFYEQIAVIAPNTTWSEIAAAQRETLAVGTNTSVSAQPAAGSEVPVIQFPK